MDPRNGNGGGGGSEVETPMGRHGNWPSSRSLLHHSMFRWSQHFPALSCNWSINASISLCRFHSTPLPSCQIRTLQLVDGVKVIHSQLDCDMDTRLMDE